jgi:hypothetical protein
VPVVFDSVVRGFDSRVDMSRSQVDPLA